MPEPGTEIRHLVDENLHDCPEGQRHHCEVGAGDTQRRQSQHQAEQGCDDGRRHDRRPEPEVEVHEQHARRIGANSEQRRMADRDFAGVAEDDVETERHDAEDGDGDEQMQVIGTCHREGTNEDRGQRDKGEQRLAHLRPS